MEDYYESFKAQLRDKVQELLEQKDYNKVFYITGIITEEELETIDEEDNVRVKARGFFELARLFDQYEADTKEKAEYFGIEKNYKKAADFYMKSASLGKMAALDALFSVYKQNGEEEKAEKILELGVKAKRPKCCYIMGIRYFKNNDYEKAFELFSYSYSISPQWGGCELAKMYEEGLGVEKNTREAFYYYLDAADCGDKLAMYNVGMLYKKMGQLDSAKYYLKQSVQNGISGKRRDNALYCLSVIEELGRE